MAQRDNDAPASPELPALSSSGGRDHGKGLYKPGQGYWTRVGTTIGLVCILLSGIAWLAKQCELITIPMPTWTLTLSGVEGTPTPGSTVDLLGEPKTPDAPAPKVGSAKVVEVSKGTTGRTQLLIENITLEPEVKTIRESHRISSASGVAAKVEGSEGVPAFNLVWLQGAASLAMLLVGGGLIYWFVGVRPKSVDFLIATDSEMKKVNWSTRKTIIDSTQMVVLACVLIAGAIYLIDMIFRWFFSLIRVLET